MTQVVPSTRPMPVTIPAPGAVALHMSTSIQAVILALVSVLVVGCSPAAVVSLLPATTTPLVTVTTRGGECPEGACGSTIAIEHDGWVHRPEPDGVGLGQ